ncbi:jg25931, partial [Pararge aegeria aegeria]
KKKKKKKSEAELLPNALIRESVSKWVCCSKFPVTQDRAGVTKPPLPVSSLRSSGHDRITCSPALDSNETMALYEFQGLEPKVNSTDPIETHPNVRLLPSKCGTVDGIKIFNGKIAKLYELPWMALIAYETENGSEFHCAGSVINSRYILTAAHCVFNTEYSKYERITSVRIGEVNLQTPYDCQGVGANLICECIIQNINVEDIIPHENFGGLTSKQNDIALLRLSEPINFTRNAFPICLPVSSDLRNIGLEGKKAVVAGWGLTENYIKSNILLKIEIPIWSSRRCRKVWNRGNDDFKKLCAGGSIQDSCTGDSGGPLIVDSYYVGRRSYVQYGIISYGPKPCATVGIPGVYTYVDKYMQWILDNIRE